MINPEHEEIVRRFEAAFRDGGLEQLAALYTEDVVMTPPPNALLQPAAGREAVARLFADLRQTFDDLDVETEVVVSAGDWFVQRQVVRGTGGRGGVPVDVTSFGAVRVEGELIAELTMSAEETEARSAAGIG